MQSPKPTGKVTFKFMRLKTQPRDYHFGPVARYIGDYAETPEGKFSALNLILAAGRFVFQFGFIIRRVKYLDPSRN